MKIGVAAALAAIALSSVATAQTPESPFARDSAVLSLKGLDLASADGQRRLAIRVDQASRAVCGDETLSRVHLDLAARARQCRAEVAADVRDQIEARSARADTMAGTRLASLR